jgi:hypothetical protein
MNHFFLLDVAPDPVSAGVGFAGLIVIGIVVLMITAAVLVGFVFLLKRLRRNGGSTRLVVGDVCLNLDNAASQPGAQPQSSPNQP